MRDSIPDANASCGQPASSFMVEAASLTRLEGLWIFAGRVKDPTLHPFLLRALRDLRVEVKIPGASSGAFEQIHGQPFDPPW